MSLYCLDLNDAGITVCYQDAALVTSPGFALIQDGGLLTGTPAQSQARLLPRQTLSHFWQRLGVEPLSTPLGSVRHHADVAHAHLQNVHEQAGNPDALLCIVPGSFDRQQLGVLLGIIEQCPFRASGLVDAAVAGSVLADGQGPALHLDVQLHQAVLTHLEIGDQVARHQVEVIAGTGIAQLHDAWARLIAQAFIQQCRFDPLHDAKTEQRLYDNLEQWLGGFTDESEQLMQLEAGGVTHQAKLRREQIIRAAEPVYGQWRQRLSEADNALKLISHRIAALPGFSLSVEGAQTLPAGASFEACKQHRVRIESDTPELRFVTRLPHLGNSGGPTSYPRKLMAGAVTTAAAPTHLLANSDAYEIPPSGLYLLPDSGLNGGLNGGLSFVRQQPDFPSALLRHKAGCIQLDVPSGISLHVNGEPCIGSRTLASGDRLSADGQSTVQLIRVIRDGA